MQKIPFAASFFKLLLPLYPLAFESFDFDNYDLVISSTTRFAKSIITKPKTCHISYLNSTPRFLWEEDKKNVYLPKILLFLLSPFFRWLKRWDLSSAQRVDYFLANSQNVSQKILKIYRRKNKVIYPFADTTFFTPDRIHNWKLKSKNYYLIVTRLVKWKKIDIAIEAVNDIGANLIIIGDGPDKGRLEGIAVRDQRSGTRDQVTFIGKITREELKSCYQNCRALIVTQEEDFGIATVEAQACGTPVIAYGKGGTVEIITDKKTGVFFSSQTMSSLKDAISTSSRLKYDKLAIRHNALRFTKTNFEKIFKEIVRQYAKSA